VSDEIAYSAAKHPGEHRDRVGWAALYYGLFAAPIFWAGNFMVDYGLVTHACYPGNDPRWDGQPGFRFAWWLALLFYFITLGVCASAGYVSHRNWIETRSEAEGAIDEVIELGHGRTRYLAMIGIWFSALFFAATLFGIVIWAIEPLCAF
jgi:hypothetical protein